MRAPNTKFDFEPIAERYDRCNHLFSFGIDYLWRREIVRVLKPQSQQRFLDVCTGTGDLVFALLKHSPVRHVTGLDVSEAMLAGARKKEKRLSSKAWLRDKEIGWVLGDAAGSGLESRSFDCITCAFGMRNIPDRAAALAEMHRLLKSGGMLCVLEFSLPVNPLLRRLYSFYLNRMMPAAGKIIVGSVQPLKYLAASIHHWHRDVNFARELSAGGFVLVHKKTLTAGIATLWLARKQP